MKAVEVMISEHGNVLRLNKVMRKACAKILDGETVCVPDFRNMIEFVRNYVDKHHHGKEEQILFAEMVANLGRIGENLISYGIMVEHDMARLHIYELETALDRYEAEPTTDAKLDIIASAVSYTKLLERHIGKEDEVVYTYAEKHLPEAVLSGVDSRASEFEKQAAVLGTQKKYLDILAELESRYL